METPQLTEWAHTRRGEIRRYILNSLKFGPMVHSAILAHVSSMAEVPRLMVAEELGSLMEAGSIDMDLCETAKEAEEGILNGHWDK